MRVSFLNRLIILMTAAVLAGCGGRGDYPVKQETVNGMLTVTCPAYPRDGIFEYDMVEELCIGDRTDDDNYILNRPNQIQVDSRGSIYMLDWGDFKIQVYDSSGAWIRTIGREGQGPGEFSMPAYFTLSSRDTIYLNDARNRRINVYNTAGRCVRTLRYEGGFHSLYFEVGGKQNLEKLSDEYTIIEESFSVERLPSNSDPGYAFGPYRGDRKEMKRVGDLIFSGGSPDGPNTLWTVTKAGLVIEGYNMDYRLNVINADGTVRLNFGRPFDPVPNPYAGKSVHLDTKPAYGRTILLDDNGNIWLKLYTKDPESEDEPPEIIYDVWSPEVVYLKQVRLAHTIHAFHGNRVYCIVRSADDIPLIKRYRLVEKQRSHGR